MWEKGESLTYVTKQEVLLDHGENDEEKYIGRIIMII